MPLSSLNGWQRLGLAILAIPLLVGIHSIYKAVVGGGVSPPSVRTDLAPTPPKPVRPSGLILVSKTGGEGEITKWYLRAETVMGPRTKRLFWVSLDLSEDKSSKYESDEQLHSVNCETMEMRRLKSTFYKKNDEQGYSVKSDPYDKAEVNYPTPSTGLMALYKEVCKDVYDIASS
jgi:hypothetical protein